jgi:hypothetical protein
MIDIHSALVEKKGEIKTIQQKLKASKNGIYALRSPS